MDKLIRGGKFSLTDATYIKEMQNLAITFSCDVCLRCMLWSLAYRSLGWNWVIKGTIKKELYAWIGIRDDKGLRLILLATFLGYMKKKKNRMDFKGTETNFDRSKDI